MDTANNNAAGSRACSEVIDILEQYIGNPDYLNVVFLRDGIQLTNLLLRAQNKFGMSPYNFHSSETFPSENFPSKWAGGYLGRDKEKNLFLSLNNPSRHTLISQIIRVFRARNPNLKINIVLDESNKTFAQFARRHSLFVNSDCEFINLYYSIRAPKGIQVQVGELYVYSNPISLDGIFF